MPSGYTEPIAKGISFKQFIMGCARAFGACVSLRDDSADTPIPDEFKPSDYHRKELAKARAALARTQAMTNRQAHAAAQAEFRKRSAEHKQHITKAKALRRKYEAMFRQVQQWTPPTAEHTGLKDFMAKQITESIGFDCDTAYYEEHRPAHLAGPAWRTERIVQLGHDIAYHTAEHAAEVARAAERTAWVKALRESLK